MSDDIITIDKWNSGEVKNVLDETAKQVILQHFKYDESNFLVDVRLFLCSLPIVAAFFGMVYDWLNPFPQSAAVLKFCVYSYLIFTIILTVYSVFVESNTILIGFKKSEKKEQGKKGKKEKAKRGNKKTIRIRLLSKMKRFDDQYTLILEGPNKQNSITRSVGRYFDVNGTFVQNKFEQDVVKLHNKNNQQ